MLKHWQRCCLSQGKKPAALDKVVDPETRAFIEKCLAPASQRLPARALLDEDFLKERDPNEVKDLPHLSRPHSKADELDRMVAAPDGLQKPIPVPEPRILQKSELRRNGGVESSGSDRESQKGGVESGVSRRNAGIEAERRSKREEREEEGPTVPVERTSSLKDFKVKGKKSADDDVIYLKLRIADVEGEALLQHPSARSTLPTETEPGCVMDGRRPRSQHPLSLQRGHRLCGGGCGGDGGGVGAVQL